MSRPALPAAARDPSFEWVAARSAVVDKARYRTDFEILEVLGSGTFGTTHKVSRQTAPTSPPAAVTIQAIKAAHHPRTPNSLSRPLHRVLGLRRCAGNRSGTGLTRGSTR